MANTRTTRNVQKVRHIPVRRRPTCTSGDDKSNKPIIVDQPEENLDSQTVYRLLIPVIKDVKKRRQIIMVTHSPNIAVVCDAEQIIHAHIDRAAGNAVIYTMGAIESPAINRFLVDVLEGTRPAFDNRDAKYFTP